MKPFVVLNFRTHFSDRERFIFTGFFPGGKEVPFQLYINGFRYDFDYEIIDDYRLRRALIWTGMDVRKLVFASFKKPTAEVSSIEIRADRQIVYKISAKRYQELIKEPAWAITSTAVIGDKIHVMGWAIHNPVKFVLTDGIHKLPIESSRFSYTDMQLINPDLPDNINAGFEIVFTNKKYMALKLTIISSNKSETKSLSIKQVMSQGFYKDYADLVKRGRIFLSNNGLGQTLEKTANKLLDKAGTGVSFNRYAQIHSINIQELEKPLICGDYRICLNEGEQLLKGVSDKIAKIFADNPEIGIIYADELANKEPILKPDFSPEYLCHVNYIGHPLAVRSEIVGKYGDISPVDLIFRASDDGIKIYHLRELAYTSPVSWPSHHDKLAVENYLERHDFAAVIGDGVLKNTLKIMPVLAKEPMVSIVIPNKDHIDDLKACLDSIEQVNTYSNYEVLVVENNSTDKATFDFYDEISKNSHIRVIYYKGGWNFSRINNTAVREAKGDLLLLLNNDTIIINPGTIHDMVAYAMRPEIGAVGAKLLYPDNTVQHAGVIVGLGGLADHAFIGLSAKAPGYMYRASVVNNVSAVTAACLMVKKSIYEQVNGLDEEYQVAFNDVDFCLKIKNNGYRNIMNANALLYHFESKSRGMENTGAKWQRFFEEIDRLERSWSDEFIGCDPYYNPGLSRSSTLGSYILNPMI